MGTIQPEKIEEEFDPRIDLALQRTELALDRTQLAWIRTMIGIYGASIALDKGLQLLHEARLESGKAWVRSSHTLAMLLCGVTSTIFVFVTLRYWSDTRRLAGLKGTPSALIPPVFVTSLLTFLLGLVLFLLMLTS